MALNLRTIDKPLHDALKLWAMGAGKNLDEFCVEILRDALLRGTVLDSKRGVGVAATLSVSKTESAGSSPAGPAKSDMPALREICLGNITIIADERVKPGEIRLGVHDGPLVAHNVGTAPPCIVCDSPMREVKGKWACQDVSCGMYGKEQKVKK